MKTDCHLSVQQSRLSALPGRPPVSTALGPLAAGLQTLADPRGRHGKCHRFVRVLLVACSTVVAGACSFTAIGQWARSDTQDTLARLGARTTTVFGVRLAPSAAAIRRLINRTCGPGRRRPGHARARPSLPRPGGRPSTNGFPQRGATTRAEGRRRGPRLAGPRRPASQPGHRSAPRGEPRLPADWWRSRSDEAWRRKLGAACPRACPRWTLAQLYPAGFGEYSRICAQGHRPRLHLRMTPTGKNLLAGQCRGLNERGGLALSLSGRAQMPVTEFARITG